MLIPRSLFKVLEYDAIFVVTPTSRFDHASDTLLAIVEMLIENDQAEEVEFPFYVLTVDSGMNAESPESVAPHVLNGSSPVEIADEGEVNEAEFADLVVQQARSQGITDEGVLQSVRAWGEASLAKAERVKVGRTRIAAGARRRIILQQRIRLLPDGDGRFTLEVIAPPPLGVIPIGGRISLFVILPWEDQDIKVQIDERTEGFELEHSRLKMRQWVGWHWQNDPLLRVVYRYLA